MYVHTLITEHTWGGQTPFINFIDIKESFHKSQNNLQSNRDCIKIENSLQMSNRVDCMTFKYIPSNFLTSGFSKVF